VALPFIAALVGTYKINEGNGYVLADSIGGIGPAYLGKNSF